MDKGRKSYGERELTIVLVLPLYELMYANEKSSHTDLSQHCSAIYGNKCNAGT